MSNFKELEVGDVVYNTVTRRYIIKLSDWRYYDIDRKRVSGFPSDYPLNNDIYEKAKITVFRQENAPAAEANQKMVVIPPEMIKGLVDTLMEVIKGIDWNSLMDKMIDMKKEEEDGK